MSDWAISSRALFQLRSSAFLKDIAPHGWYRNAEPGSVTWIELSFG